VHGDAGQPRIPSEAGVGDTGVVETGCEEEDGSAGSGLPGVRVENVDHTGGTLTFGVYSVESEILFLMGAGELGESSDD